ncbi:hypothetical protein VNO80_15663 [Phaseolus coccineus]|uniref:Uncharacterized protein n=1 Tax=Phaseolus coccineus TaxID=3886 RepID=A0AAN9MQP5_PHACN
MDGRAKAIDALLGYEGDTTRRLNTEQKLLHHATQRSAKPLPNPDSAPISFQRTKVVFARKKERFLRFAPANSAFAGRVNVFLREKLNCDLY